MEKKYEPARKQGFTVNLDPNATRIVKEWLDTQKQSFSSWVNLLVVEMAKQISGQPTPWTQPLSKLTVAEFVEMMNYWKKAIEHVDEELKEEGFTLPKA